MTDIKLFISALTFLIVNAMSDTQAQNWPNWRGPGGDGTSTEINLPTRWDSITNVVWKSPVPGIGHSSPVVWEDKLFITAALPGTQEKLLLCYGCRDGALLWQKSVLKSPFEFKHADNSYASGTPATDGTLVYISFLDGEDVIVAAYDYHGNQIWLQRPGTFSSPHGYSCSPALFEDKIIINGNSMGDSFLAALRKTDGEIIWKIPLDHPAHSFSTPIFREMAGKMQMIYLGNKEVASYNPDDGSKYWFVSGPSEDFCASPVYNQKTGLVLISSAWPQRILLAIKPDGAGDVTESHVVWRSTSGAYYVPSPVCTDAYLFTTMTNGNVHCIDIASGNVLWSEDMGRQYSSPVLADGLVYMPNDEGMITVIKPGPAFHPVARNNLGERMNASPAISNGKIYLRGDKHLFCIGNQLPDSGKYQALTNHLSSRNPIVDHMYTADPSAHVFNGRLYVYPSHDRDNSVTFDMMDYHVFSTTNMVEWTDHGLALSLENVNWATRNAWAPDCGYANGRYYFYFPTDQSYIGVAVGDSPGGPFRDALGKPLVTKESPGVVNKRDFIDPAIFIDDDGTPYLFFGQLDVNVVKLNPDMVSYDGPVHIIEGAKDFFEAVWVHKYNGKYYLSYSTWGEKGVTGPQIVYATSENVLGPYEYQGVILDEVSSGTNHHSIVQFKAHWYLFYHTSDLFTERTDPGSAEYRYKPYRRSICVDRLFYNEDGTIQKVVPTRTGVGVIE